MSQYHQWSGCHSAGVGGRPTYAHVDGLLFHDSPVMSTKLFTPTTTTTTTTTSTTTTARAPPLVTTAELESGCS
ncbi:hypothetical protein Pmani_023231 [Petrolisthes manimaculis]|uniref:Uncharacterized protein n=1 Tax=Petrolisthes manimaculis TaxID=1843537 RepID=A0AAE1PCA6_9EUCA|nr:hypothetical protein Pmani_023231 [Petrolisthes manimaculis]